MISQRAKRKCVVLENDKKTVQQVREASLAWYDVIDATSPNHALDLLKAHADVSIFITQHSSERFNCIDVLERVRSSYPDVRRVVMTSYLELSGLINGLHTGTIQKLVQKPVNRVELQSAIVPTDAPVERRLAG